MTSYCIPTIFEFQNPSGTKVWKIEAVVGYKNGQRVKTRRTAHSLREAKQIRQELIALAAAGDLRQSSNTNLRDYARYWIESVKAGRIKQSTVNDYHSRFESYIYPYLGNVAISQLRAKDIEQWMGLLKRKGYSTSTVNGARRILHGLFHHARKEDLISKNPVELTDPYRRLLGDRTMVKKAWSKEEVLDALRKSRGTEFDLFLHLALLLGLRRGEMLALREQDIDLEAGLVHINGTLKEQRMRLPSGERVIKLVRDTTKTTASNRSVGLPWPVMDSLMRHRQHLQLLQQGSRNWNETDWVFKGSTGAVVFPSNFASRFKKFLKDNQIREIRIHDLRHTMAELALANAIPIEGVSETLGHTRIDTTKSIYAPKVLQLAIDTPHKLAEALISMEKSFGFDPALSPRLDSGSTQGDG